jgi:hypothetical protein
MSATASWRASMKLTGKQKLNVPGKCKTKDLQISRFHNDKHRMLQFT